MKLQTVCFLVLFSGICLAEPLLLDSNSLLKDIRSAATLKFKNNCVCGVFMDEGDDNFRPKKKTPLFTNDITIPLSVCTEQGKRFCTNKCRQMVIQHMPSMASLICSSANEDMFGERLRLYTKTCDEKWIDSGFAPAKQYCCENGEETKCIFNKSGYDEDNLSLSSLLNLSSGKRSIPDILLGLADKAAEIASNVLEIAENNLA